MEIAEAGEIDVAEADKIVSGGRGIKGPENWPILKTLADALGGAVGASRAASTPAGSSTTTRSGRRARSSRRTSTSPAASRAPSSTWRAWAPRR